ncbi:MAG: DUF3667 domain-containing protein [Pseudomonadota bacterium]
MVDIEATGGLVTGGMIGAAIEKPTGHAGEHHSATCSDCGEPVTANFCANCGQPTHVHRTLLHLGEELLHGVMHFDARIWRTLPLLIANPGRLTREWVEGKRTRYVSPLALFLFTVFLMFFILSFAPHREAEAPIVGRIAEQRQELGAAQQALAAIQADPSTRTEDGETKAQVIAEAQRIVDARKASLDRLEIEMRDGRADGLTPGSWQAGLKDQTADMHPTGKFQALSKKLLKKLQNPDLLLYKLQQTMYKYAFLLVPLSIPFVGLLFLWKRQFTFYDHGVFVLYSLTFIAILGMAVVAFFSINATLGGFALMAAFLGVPVHMFAQLKGAYALSIFSAAWRTFFLLNFCTFVLTLFTMAVLYLGLGL